MDIDCVTWKRYKSKNAKEKTKQNSNVKKTGKLTKAYLNGELLYDLLKRKMHQHQFYTTTTKTTTTIKTSTNKSQFNFQRIIINLIRLADDNSMTTLCDR